MPIRNDRGANTAVRLRGTTQRSIKSAKTINGDGSTTVFSIKHNLNTRDCHVTVMDSATFAQASPTIVHTDQNTITLTFSVAPALGVSYRVTVIG